MNYFNKTVSLKKHICRNTIVQTCIFYFSGFSPNLHWLAFLRFAVGVTLGVMPQIVTYSVDFLPNNLRISPMCIPPLHFGVGQICNVIVTMYIYPLVGWRIWLIACTLPTGITCLLCLMLPESPHFTMSTGRSKEAFHILKLIAEENKVQLRGVVLKSDYSEEDAKPDNLDPNSIYNFKKLTFLCSFMFAVHSFSYFGLMIYTPAAISDVYTNRHEIINHDKGQQFNSSEEINTSNSSHYLLSRCNEYIDSETIDSKCKPLTQLDYKFTIITLLLTLPTVSIISILENIMTSRTAVILGLLVFGFSNAIVIIFEKATVVMFGLARAAITLGYNMMFLVVVEMFPVYIRSRAIGIADAFGSIGSLVTPFAAHLLLSYSLKYTMALYSTVAIVSSVIMIIFFPKKETNNSKEKTRLIPETKKN